MVHISNVNVAVWSDRDITRHVEIRRRRRTAVADRTIIVAWRADPRDGVNESGSVIDHPDAVVQGIGDVDITVGRGGDAARLLSAASVAG